VGRRVKGLNLSCIDAPALMEWLTDTVVVMLTPESGDGVQIMKAGPIEIADVFVVNKCDCIGEKNIVQSLKGRVKQFNVS